MNDKFVDMNINDALIEKPHGFSVDVSEGTTKRFYLYPTTLGKMYIIKRHLDNLEINHQNLSTNAFLETLRIVQGKREEVCRIITYNTLKKKRDVFDQELVDDRTEFFDKNCSNEDLASLLLYILTKDDVESFKKHLGITKENDRMNQVISAKNEAQKSKNDYTFGGKTIYGTLIDVACERYSWSYDYVVWGISLVNLKMMMADRVQNIYISDEEKKKIPSSLLSDGDVIKADDKANRDKILQMDWR